VSAKAVNPKLCDALLGPLRMKPCGCAKAEKGKPDPHDDIRENHTQVEMNHPAQIDDSHVWKKGDVTKTKKPEFGIASQTVSTVQDRHPYEPQEAKPGQEKHLHREVTEDRQEE